MDPAADGWPILSTRKLPSARAAAHEASRWPWATRFPRNTLHVPMPPCAGPATGLQLLLRSSRPATDQLHEVALQARPAGVTCRAAHPQLSVRRGHRTDRTPSLLQAAQRRWGQAPSPSVHPAGTGGTTPWQSGWGLNHTAGRDAMPTAACMPATRISPDTAAPTRGSAHACLHRSPCRPKRRPWAPGPAGARPLDIRHGEACAQIEAGVTEHGVVHALCKQSRTGGETLLQLVGLVQVRHAQGVEVLATPHLELHTVVRLLDLDGLGILPPRGEEEILDLLDLLRLSSGERAG